MCLSCISFLYPVHFSVHFARAQRMSDNSGSNPLLDALDNKPPRSTLRQRPPSVTPAREPYLLRSAPVRQASLSVNGFIPAGADVKVNKLTSENVTVDPDYQHTADVWSSFLRELFGTFIMVFIYGIVYVIQKSWVVSVQGQSAFVLTSSINNPFVTTPACPNNNTNTTQTLASLTPTILLFTQNISSIIGGATTTTTAQNPGYLFASSFILAALIYTLIRMLPGCKFNPAFTILNFCLMFKEDGTAVQISHRSHGWIKLFVDLVAQFVGSLTAVAVCYLWMQSRVDMLGDSLPSTMLSHDWEIIIYEGLGYLFLCVMLAQSSEPYRDDFSTPEQALYVAGVNFMLHMLIEPFTGFTCWNYFRSLSVMTIRYAATSVAAPSSQAYYLAAFIIGLLIAMIPIHFLNADYLRQQRNSTSIKDDAGATSDDESGDEKEDEADTKQQVGTEAVDAPDSPKNTDD
jgi:glycerol uptake facilitator-like aquaporin